MICLALLIFCLVERQVRRAIAPASTLEGLYLGQPAKPTGRLIFEALARLRLLPAAGRDPPIIPQPPPLQARLLDLLDVDPPDPPDRYRTRWTPTASMLHQLPCAKDPASRIGAGLADSGDRQQHADNGNQGSSIRITLPGRAEIGIRRSVVDVRVGQPCKMAQAFGALSVLLGWERTAEEARGAVAHALGQVEVVTAGCAVEDFGDDDEFGELAGGGVEDVGEFAADSSRTRRPWSSSVRVLVQRRCRGAGCRCAAGR